MLTNKIAMNKPTENIFIKYPIFAFYKQSPNESCYAFQIVQFRMFFFFFMCQNEI